MLLKMSFKEEAVKYFSRMSCRSGQSRSIMLHCQQIVTGRAYWLIFSREDKSELSENDQFWTEQRSSKVNVLKRESSQKLDFLVNDLQHQVHVVLSVIQLIQLRQDNNNICENGNTEGHSHLHRRSNQVGYCKRSQALRVGKNFDGRTPVIYYYCIVNSITQFYTFTIIKLAKI